MPQNRTSCIDKIGLISATIKAAMSTWEPINLLRYCLILAAAPAWTLLRLLVHLSRLECCGSIDNVAWSTVYDMPLKPLCHRQQRRKIICSYASPVMCCIMVPNNDAKLVSLYITSRGRNFHRRQCGHVCPPNNGVTTNFVV